MFGFAKKRLKTQNNMSNKNKNTYFGLSTPLGRSATATIRLSGWESKKTLEKLTAGKLDNPKHRTSYVVDIYNKNNTLIDNVIILYFKGPNSYTGDDLVEIHSHGNPIIIEQICETLLNLGLRPAEAGEFTRAAYLNNKIDLVQAESILSLINSNTIDGVNLSLNSVSGSLSIKTLEMRKEIIEALGLAEYELDISETDTHKQTIKVIKKRINRALLDTTKLISTAKSARINTLGASVVIYGKPNVGKSTLFNTLLNYERSIVTDTAGTTRDTVDVASTIGRHSVVLVDTAGIRKTEDIAEKLGVERTQEKINEADISIQVVTGAPSTKAANPNNITVLNKTDLLEKNEINNVRKNKNVICVSAKNKTGIPSLLKQINKKLDSKSQCKIETQITSTRQKQRLKNIQKELEKVLRNKETNLEIIAHHLTCAIKEFDSLLGKTSTDDVLDSVFSSFCVGK